MPHSFDLSLRDTAERQLAAFPAKQISDLDLRRAAVALVIAPHIETGEASMLLTLRPVKLNRHGGQYAFPGGRLDEGESPQQAALRELHEELGLDLPQTSVLGRLDDYATRSGFVMSPFVLWAGEGAAITPDPSEVAQVFHVPLVELLGPGVPVLLDSEAGGEKVLAVDLPVLGHRMYAPTAAILYQFREVVLRGKTTRVAHFDQPRFAWK